MLLGVALLVLLIPGIGLTQSGKGGKGGKGGKQRGGGPPDPGQMFDFMSRGQGYVDAAGYIARSERRDPSARARIEQFLAQQGITNGQINRDQFILLMQQQMAQMGSLGPSRGGPSGPGGPSVGTTNGGYGGTIDDDERAKRAFLRRDKNGDGVLTTDEMDDTLRAELSTWDTNGDGRIDFEEYKAYFKARMQYRRGGQNDDGSGLDQGLGNPQTPPPETKRYTVYRAGNLPKELPPWFAQLDRDFDGQVALYEWKAAGLSLAEFEKWDANGDGFITVEEALRFQKKEKEIALKQAKNNPQFALAPSFNGGVPGMQTSTPRTPGGSQMRPGRGGPGGRTPGGPGGSRNGGNNGNPRGGKGGPPRQP
jgi:hypothetical protein